MTGQPSRRRSPVARALFALMLAAFFCLFVALGTWQVHRRAWKLDLIAQVDRRIHAPPVPAPVDPRMTPAEAKAQDYLHVRATGVWLNDRETLTQAVSDSGPGYWVMTPLREPGGATILVNRGFVDEDHAAPARHRAPQGTVTVTGLLRPSEPNGGFLQANDPARGQWHSRDVAAIGRARGLPPLPPCFVDADAASEPGPYPLGGQTIVAFPNNHLVYLLTWYGLAVLVVVAGVIVFRSERKG